MAEEADRTAHYLSSNTQPPLQELLVEHLLTSHLQHILEMPGTGLVSMLDGDKISDLRRLYTLFCKVPDNAGKQALRIALRSDIEERGKGVNEAAITEPEAGPSGKADEADGAEGDDTKGKVKAKPTSASSALASALRWVQDVLDLKDKFDRTLDEALGGNKAMMMSTMTDVSEKGEICVYRH